MQEMRVEMLDINVEFASQDEGLTQPTTTVCRPISSQISQPLGARRLISGLAAYTPPGPPDARNLLAKIFG